MLALVLGHGPSISSLQYFDPTIYDIVLTCHDDCCLNEFWPDFHDFIICSSDGHDNELRGLYSWWRKGYRIWHFVAHPLDQLQYRENIDSGKWDWFLPLIEEKEIDPYSRLLSGLSAINWCFKNGYKRVHTLGIDNTYLKGINRQERLPLFYAMMEYYYPGSSYLSLDQSSALQDGAVRSF